jgi:ankyrin repeat protein
MKLAIGNMHTANNANPLDNDRPNQSNGRALVKLLVERGANPNQQQHFGASALEGAADRGLTPFLLACNTGDLEVVRLLLANGANPRLATADARGPLIMAVSGRGGGADRVALLKLLADVGADVNLIAKRHFLARTRGGSALHYAVRSGGNAQLIQTLLDLGQNIDARDEDGLTALDYAMGRGFVPFLATAQPPDKALSARLRALGAKVELASTPEWPPQGPPIATAVYDSVLWPVESVVSPQKGLP